MNRRLKGEWGDRPSGRREPHSKNSEVKYTRDCRFNVTEPGCVLGNKCGKGGWGNRSESLPALLQLGLYSWWAVSQSRFLFREKYVKMINLKE